MDHLSQKDEAFLSNMGIGGALLTVTCFVQLILVMADVHWISFTILAIYLLALASYILMIKRSALAPPLLFASGILIFLAEAYLILSTTYSLVLLLLLIYSAVTIALVYSSGIIKKLQKRDLAEKQENENWKNLI